MTADIMYMNTEFDIETDEIEFIEYLGEQDTIDINTSGDRLFYANGILTHNSAIEEIEFDHSHISGGISKINTADNVFGIFTSRSMRERGLYQLQLMKTRSSSGVGQKVELAFDMDTLRITDINKDENEVETQTPAEIINKIKTTSSIVTTNDMVEEQVIPINKHVVADTQGAKLKALLNNLKK